MGTAPPAQGEVEGEQLSAGAGRGVSEGEALARHGVLERLAWVDHATSELAQGETFHG